MKVGNVYQQELASHAESILGHDKLPDTVDVYNVITHTTVRCQRKTEERTPLIMWATCHSIQCTHVLECAREETPTPSPITVSILYLSRQWLGTSKPFVLPVTQLGEHWSLPVLEGQLAALDLCEMLVCFHSPLTELSGRGHK